VVELTDVIERGRAAYQAIKPHILQTPLYPSHLGPNLLIKAENVQYTGSFKLRGACSKVIQLAEEGHKTLITASTGNHGLAVATIAKQLGILPIIYVPESIISLKEKKLTDIGANLYKVPGSSEQSELRARKEAKAQGIPFISPYNDLDVIAGQATIAIELKEQTDLNEVNTIYITIGGGGLIAGIGSFLKKQYPHIEIIGCQPANSTTMYYSIQQGEVVEITHEGTLSDGSAGGIEKDSITFPLAQQIIDRFILVDEDQIREAMRLAFKEHNTIIEGSAGVALAGYLADDKPTSAIVVWCGGNIDPTRWLDVIIQT